MHVCLCAKEKDADCVSGGLSVYVCVSVCADRVLDLGSSDGMETRNRTTKLESSPREQKEEGGREGYDRHKAW